MGDLLKEWLLHFETRMNAENCKVLLLIDNCSDHNNIPWHLGQVKFMFLLPNHTSIYSPLIWGVSMLQKHIDHD
jgi:hypothetical protein